MNVEEEREFMKTRNVQLVRPVDQMRILYRPTSDDDSLSNLAHNLFRQRMRFDMFTRQTLCELIEVQRRALAEDPINARLKYELAFVLLQNEAGPKQVQEAYQLLTSVIAGTCVSSRLAESQQPSGKLADAAKRLLRLTDILKTQSSTNQKRTIPRRVNWAVNNRCVMVCRGCYNLFSPNQLTLDQIKLGVDKLVHWRVHDMIISGGDPIVWPDLADLIDYIHASGLAVGIDTTGYTMTDELLERLAGKVSYLGLPLDGSTNPIQNGFRRGPKDMVDRLKENLARCDALGIPVKINTTFTAYNSEDLLAIGAIISQYRCVKNWSVFQWWALRTTAEITQKMSVPDALFEARVEEAGRHYPQFNLRSRNVKDRELTHFFIRNNGQIVTFGAGLHEELLLGHILEHDETYIIGRAALNMASSKNQPVARFTA